MLTFHLHPDIVARPLNQTITTAELEEHRREATVIVDLLQHLHYSARQFHEIDPKEMVEAYLDRLDPDKLTFTREDLARWNLRFGRTLKTVYLLRGDEAPALEIAEEARTQTMRRIQAAQLRLATYDFEACGVIGRNPVRAKDAEELDARWDNLARSAVIEARLSGRSSDDAIEEVSARFDRWRKQLEAMRAENVRERFWESQLSLFDPHSGYWSAESAREFQVMMKGSVTGVGLEVAMKEGVPTIVGIRPGGPADESGAPQLGDQIVAVIDPVIGRSEMESVDLPRVLAVLRGDVGTKVNIVFRAPGLEGTRDVTLSRRDVVLPELVVHGGITELPAAQPAKVGWIILPDFYRSPADGSRSSATRDVAGILTQFRTAGVHAVVIDLRQNGGGALEEAVAMSGLFLPSGLVLALRDGAGHVDRYEVPSHVPAFAGPLVVLTSAGTASASEVFAGAMQYHHRALIVGEGTFGKGTAQTYVDLGHRSGRPAATGWGMVRITHQRFYFPDGRSPQCTGVKPDIIIAGTTQPGEKTESQLPHALPEDRIEVGAQPRVDGGFAVVTPESIASLRRRSDQREAAFPERALARQAIVMAERYVNADRHLQLSERMKQQSADDREIEQWRRSELAMPSLPTTIITLPAVQEAQASHQQWSRSRHAGADAGSGRLERGQFCFIDEVNQLREVPLTWFSYRRAALASAELAPPLGRVAGRDVSPTELESLLTHFAARATLTDIEMIDLAKQILRLDAVPARGAVETLLRSLCAGEPSLRSRTTWDFSLREAIRIAADCTDDSMPK